MLDWKVGVILDYTNQATASTGFTPNWGPAFAVLRPGALWGPAGHAFIKKIPARKRAKRDNKSGCKMKGWFAVKEQKSPFNSVEEREVAGEIFQVTHRLLRVPRETYLEAVSQHGEPFSEHAVQGFVEQYLKWCGDKEGVLGMVRMDEEDDVVVLDAAVRYRINPHNRPLCQSD